MAELTRFQAMYKAEPVNPHQKIATANIGSSVSCISLPSHILFLNVVEEIYNNDSSLCMYRKKKYLFLLHVML